jgi:hypothetical protein
MHERCNVYFRKNEEREKKKMQKIDFQVSVDDKLSDNSWKFEHSTSQSNKENAFQFQTNPTGCQPLLLLPPPPPELQAVGTCG